MASSIRLKVLRRRARKDSSSRFPLPTHAEGTEDRIPFRSRQVSSTQTPNVFKGREPREVSAATREAILSELRRRQVKPASTTARSPIFTR